MRGTSPDIGSRQLEAVLALAEYGSFVAAAARLRLSQPALTRMVKRLEAELGVRLFDRSTRHVEITAAGRAFAAVAERMLNDLGITVQSVREAAQEGRGLVVVSCVMSVAGGLLPRTIAAYRDDRPGVEIHVREGIYATILDDVRSGVADFGISYVDELPDFAVGTALGREIFYAVVPSRHKLASRRSVTLAGLAAHPIVALPTESRTRRTIDAAAVAAGLQLRQRVVVTQIATLLALIAAGVGVGVVPGGATRGPLPPGVRVIPLAGSKLVRRMGLITLRGRELTPAATGLFSLLQREWRKPD